MKTSSRALVWVVLVFAAGILFGTALTLIVVRPDRSHSSDLTATPSSPKPPVTETIQRSDSRSEGPSDTASSAPEPRVEPRSAPPPVNPQTDTAPAQVDTLPEIDAGPPPRNPRPGARQEQMTQRIMRQLHLDPEQERLVRRILEQSREEQQRAMQRHQENLRQVRRKTLREIHSVLRPAQKRRFEQILRRLNRRNTQRR